MCFLMIVGSALGFTDTAQSSIMVGLGSGTGVGLEFCCEAEGKPNQKTSIRLQGRSWCYDFTKETRDFLGSKCCENIKISNMRWILQQTNSDSTATAVDISAIQCQEKVRGYAECEVIKLRGSRQFAAHRWLSRFSLERHLVDLFLSVVLVQRHLARQSRDILSWLAINSVF